MENAWSASKLEAAALAEKKREMVRMGLEASQEEDSDDERERVTPQGEIYPRLRLRIQQVDDEEGGEGEAPPPDPDVPANLRHLGSARVLPMSGSAQIQSAIASAKTDLQVNSVFMHPISLVVAEGVRRRANQRPTEVCLGS